jgi:glyoxylase-like metal-dependent hydrolase (beta-lactamase superfamily II)
MSALLDLHWDVFVTPGIPTVTSDRPPGTTQQLWSPIASTLISGKRDAILVDTFLTVEPAGALVVDGVAARGKNLTTIDATHGHGDHCFGASIVLQPGNDDSPTIIEETRQYIRDVDRVAETTTTARELYDTMLECYPERVNPGLALWLSARAVTPSYRSPTLHPTITGGRICVQ